MSPEPTAAIIDLDGTVYRGDRLVPGADEGIERRADYSEKLTQIGVPADRDDVINSGWVTARHVAEHHPDAEVFVVGERPLVEELQRAGVHTTREAPGDVLVVSMDREFDYRKLELALRTVEDGAPFLATNPDRTCPTEDGAIPDAAGMIGAVEGVSGREPDAVLGKHAETMVETAVDSLGVPPEACLMIGDRLATDIAMGERAGMRTVLVRSGVTSEAALADAAVEPDHVLNSLADVGEVLDR
jgi:arabinose operon protein AraL